MANILELLDSTGSFFTANVYPFLHMGGDGQVRFALCAVAQTRSKTVAFRSINFQMLHPCLWET
jgi:hypothetical protein